MNNKSLWKIQRLFRLSKNSVYRKREDKNEFEKKAQLTKVTARGLSKTPRGCLLFAFQHLLSVSIKYRHAQKPLENFPKAFKTYFLFFDAAKAYLALLLIHLYNLNLDRVSDIYNVGQLLNSALCKI